MIYTYQFPCMLTSVDVFCPWSVFWDIKEPVYCIKERHWTSFYQRSAHILVWKKISIQSVQERKTDKETEKERERERKFSVCERERQTKRERAREVCESSYVDPFTKRQIFRIVQIDNICRLQNKCDLKTEILFEVGRTHFGKRRKCW